MEKLEGITMIDFEESGKSIRPSVEIPGLCGIPNVKLEHVVGLDSLKQEFDHYIVRRIKNPEDYEEPGVDLETGFLLVGTPGRGKTLIAKAIANEAGANFIHIKVFDLHTKYPGEGERAVRTIFSHARICAPCILFFEEIDALTTKCGKEGEEFVNQLVKELDDAEQWQGVYVIGTATRLEVMDAAVLGPGRLGKHFNVPLPSPDERGLILEELAKGMPIDVEIDFFAIGRKEACENFSPADLLELMAGAFLVFAHEKMMWTRGGSDTMSTTIQTRHFERALQMDPDSVRALMLLPESVEEILSQMKAELRLKCTAHFGARLEGINPNHGLVIGRRARPEGINPNRRLVICSSPLELLQWQRRQRRLRFLRMNSFLA